MNVTFGAGRKLAPVRRSSWSERQVVMVGPMSVPARSGSGPRQSLAERASHAECRAAGVPQTR